MSQSFIINASPLVVERGTDDLSTRQVFPEPIPTPQHLPLSFFFAKKGVTSRQLTSGAARLQLYGSESFDPSGPYFNHSTLFSNGINGKGNIQMHQRIVPPDANPPATIRLYIELIPSTVPELIRDTAGKPILDANGDVQPVPGGTSVFGHKMRIVSESSVDPINYPLIMGQAVEKTGGLTGGSGAVSLPPAPGSIQDSAVASGLTSTLYPFMDIEASSQGAFANNSGIRLYPTPGDDIPDAYFNTSRSYPYRFSTLSRVDSFSSPKTVANNFGEPETTVTLSKNGLNPFNGLPDALGDLFPDLFENTTDPGLPIKYSDFGDVHVYYDEIKKVADALIAFEAGWMTTANQQSFNFDTIDYDTNVANNALVMNLLEGVSSKGAQYYTVEIDPLGPVVATTTGVSGNNIKQSVVSTVSSSTIYMENGSDGTMSDANFEAAVVAEMAKYLDPDSTVMDTAINVESIIYDSGYSLPTKKELLNFIGQRKDTFTVLGSYEPNAVVPAGTKPQALSVEFNNAGVLKTRAINTPESSYYGTPVTRAMIVGQSALVKGSLYKKRVPMTYEIAMKSAAYMGAADEEWKNGFSFDSAPGNIITETFDLQPDFIPANTKFTLWNTGLVWAQPFDRKSNFYPALQTVYDNDTSVLNSYFTALAIGYLNKIAWRAWRNFTGTTSLTNEQLVDEVNRFVENQVNNKFDGKFVVYPETIITAQDELRGYSWTLNIKLYSPNMKTVMTTSVEVYRISDLNL